MLTGTTFVAGALIVLTPQAASAVVDRTVTLDAGYTFQTIDGFGTQMIASQGDLGLPLPAMDSPEREEILDLLFDPDTGAAFSMLRIEAGSGLNYETPGFTVEPVGPSTATGTPTYVWDGDADDQVFYATEAAARGVDDFYLTAWSAPAFMKVNGDISGNAGLCGLGGSCPSGDWREAYADYLAQYVDSWATEGIDIGWVNAMNEPEFASWYQGMSITAAQAAEFIPILRDKLDERSLFDTEVACCDNGFHSVTNSYAQTILADPDAADAIGVFTSHGYENPVVAAASRTDIPTWQTEFSFISNEAFNTTYTSGSANGQATSDRIMAGLLGGLSAYFDYNAAIDQSGGAIYPNHSLIKYDSPNSYTVSKRLWVYGNYSRFIREGAVRIGADLDDDEDLSVAAFANTDGSTAVVINSHSTTSLDTAIAGVTGGEYTTYLTDDSHNLTASSSVSVGSSGSVDVTVPANSTITIVFDEADVESTGPFVELVPAAVTMDAPAFPGHEAATGADSNRETYAQSYANTAWDLTLDLGSNQTIGSVHFAPSVSSYADQYRIEYATAEHPTLWALAATETAGLGTERTYEFDPVDARYVRLAATSQVVNGGWGHAVKDLLVYGVPGPATGTLGASMNAPAFAGHEADKAIDGNPATYAQPYVADPWDLVVDLGGDRPISRITYVPMDPGSYATEYTVEYATGADPDTWTVVGTDLAGDGYQEIFDFPTVLARYVRLNVTDQQVGGAWGHAVGEFTVDNLVPIPATATMDSTPYTGYEAAKAVDGNVATYAQAAYPTPWDLSVDLGDDELIGRIDFTPSDGAHASDYTIEYATEAAPTTWTTLVTEVGTTSAPKSYNFDAVTARYLRLNVTAQDVGGGGWGHAVREFGVFRSESAYE